MTDFITSVTAAARDRGETTVARTAVVGGPLFVKPVEVVARVGRVQVGDFDPALVEANFENLVGNVVLDFPAHVRDIKTEECGGKVSLADDQGLE